MQAFKSQLGAFAIGQRSVGKAFGWASLAVLRNGKLSKYHAQPRGYARRTFINRKYPKSSSADASRKELLIFPIN